MKSLSWDAGITIDIFVNNMKSFVKKKMKRLVFTFRLIHINSFELKEELKFDRPKRLKAPMWDSKIHLKMITKKKQLLT